MEKINNLIEETYDALKEIAIKWQISQRDFADTKMQEFGEYIIMPISDFGEKFLNESDKIRQTMGKMKEEDLL